MSKIGTISLILLVISVVLVFQESPYWCMSILTFSAAILIPMIIRMWDFSGWMADKVNNLTSEKYEISFSLDDN